MSLLSVEGLGFRYPGGTDSPGFALEDVSFDLPPGGLLGILGPNGSGKSTLLRLLARVLRPASGRILWEDRPLEAFSQREAARRIATVPQEMSTLFPVTVEQMAALGRYPHAGGWTEGPADRRAVEEALRETDLLPLRHRLITRLSGGERRRVLLARALAQEPRLLLLDEPTAHLDPGHQLEFLRLMERLRRDRGLAVAAVLHDVNLAAAWCPRLLVLRRGRVLGLGPAREILDGGCLEEAYGLRPVMLTGPEGRGRYADFYHSIQPGGDK